MQSESGRSIGVPFFKLFTRKSADSYNLAVDFRYVHIFCEVLQEVLSLSLAHSECLFISFCRLFLCRFLKRNEGSIFLWILD